MSFHRRGRHSVILLPADDILGISLGTETDRSGGNGSKQGVIAASASRSLDISNSQLTNDCTAMHASTHPIRFAGLHPLGVGLSGGLRQSRKGILLYRDAQVDVLVGEEEGVVLASNRIHPI